MNYCRDFDNLHLTGDGIIIVSPVDNVYKVRTDEEGVLVV